MTGNVLFLAFAAVDTGTLPWVNLAAALACFVLGAASVSLALNTLGGSVGTIATLAVALWWALSGSSGSGFILAVTGILAFVVGGRLRR